MDAYQQIVALEDRATTSATQQNYEDARQAHLDALEAAKTMKRPRLTAVLFSRLGQTLEASGDVQTAVIAYESGFKALADDSTLELAPELARLPRVGKMPISAGSRRPFNAISFYDDVETAPDLGSPAIAQDLAAAEADPALPASLLLNIGNAYVHLSQEKVAQDKYAMALERPEMANAPVLRAYVLTSAAEVDRRLGNDDAAAQKIAEALALFGAHAAPAEKRRALLVSAGIARDHGEIERATALYIQALDLYEQAGDQRGKGTAYVSLGQQYLSVQRYAEAEAAYQQAFTLASQSGNNETLWQAHWGLGCCQQAAGRLDEAAASFQHSLDLIVKFQDHLTTDESQVAFLSSVQDVFDRLIAVHLDRGHSDERAYVEALQIVEQAHGRALRNLMDYRERRRPRSALNSPLQASDIPSSQPVFNTSQIAPGIPSRSAGFITSRTAEVNQRAPGIPSGSAQAATGVPSGETGQTNVPASRLQGAAARPALARLVFHGLLDRTAIFAVSSDGKVHGHSAPVGCHVLAARVDELRRTIGAEDGRTVRPVEQPTAPADVKPLLRSLYQDLIAPVADALPTDGTPLVIEPHASLWLTPFAALLGPDDRSLGDQWPLLYTPSAKALDEIRNEPDYGTPADLQALIVGNPTMPKLALPNGLVHLEPLPGAEEEARLVAGMFAEPRRTLLLGASADRETVEAQAQTHGILHLATHGVAYADDPLSSFIVLAESVNGGLLTARDVMSLNLPADLVTLSACQTGLGLVSGDGMIGLSRAFLVAGARSVLVSLWNVSDQATALLMENFYRNYLKHDNKAVALQAAMQAVRATPEYQDPRYWAPFVVVGAEA
jgi:CHAT domain-containing protein/tetratricopeptide (TPR) repeat protein